MVLEDQGDQEDQPDQTDQNSGCRQEPGWRCPPPACQILYYQECPEDQELQGVLEVQLGIV